MSLPQLVVINGPWGAGKTTVLRELQQSIPEPGGRCAYFDMDAVVHMGWPFGSVRKGPVREHFQQLHRLAGKIADAMFTEGAQRVFMTTSSLREPDTLRDVRAELTRAADVHHVTLELDERAHRARLLQRKHSAGQIETILRQREPELAEARTWSRLIDCSTLTPQETAAAILRDLAGGDCRVEPPA